MKPLLGREGGGVSLSSALSSCECEGWESYKVQGPYNSAEFKTLLLPFNNMCILTTFNTTTQVSSSVFWV